MAGECHKNAPVPASNMQSWPQGWPPTWPDEWCGEFAPSFAQVSADPVEAIFDAFESVKREPASLPDSTIQEIAAGVAAVMTKKEIEKDLSAEVLRRGFLTPDSNAGLVMPFLPNPAMTSVIREFPGTSSKCACPICQVRPV